MEETADQRSFFTTFVSLSAVNNFYISGVGKSCLLLQFTDKRFQPVHDLTIGRIAIFIDI